jgi:hemolysin activation/secretion protein
LIAAIVAVPVAAQEVRPGDRPLPGEEFLPEEGAPPAPLDLPLIAPDPEDAKRLGAGLRVVVREFRVEGSSVFSKEELAEATQPFVGREIDSEELLQAREAVTQLYISRGYLTSGAIIPDQAMSNGVVVLQIVEGRLTDVQLEGAHWFRPGYFRSRLLRAASTPINVLDIERQLRRFQRNPNVERIRAQLLPGERRGDSILVVTVEEDRPYALRLVSDNDRNPSIGAWGGRSEGSFSNLLGYDDQISGSVDISEGLREYAIQYNLPLFSWDTRLGFHYRNTSTEVVDDDFDELDIESDSETFGFTLRHPFYLNSEHTVWLGVDAERRESETTLLGVEFCFPPVVDCKPVINVVRAVQLWTWRTRSDVVAARSTFSVGLDVWDATTEGKVDGQYFAWLGQTQWAHLFSEKLWRTELLMRADAQFANDPLLPIEKFSLGGLNSIRGYRHNRIVRDNGVIGSLELRIPLYRNAFGRPLVQLVPFAEVGHGWDDAATLPAETLASIGVGFRISPWEWLLAEAYWGSELIDIPGPSNDDIQDDGFYIRVTITPF